MWNQFKNLKILNITSHYQKSCYPTTYKGNFEILITFLVNKIVKRLNWYEGWVWVAGWRLCLTYNICKT